MINCFLDDKAYIDRMGDLIFFNLRNDPKFLCLIIKVQELDFDCQAWFKGYKYYFSYVNMTIFDLPKHSITEWSEKITNYILSEMRLYKSIDKWKLKNDNCKRT